MTLRGRGGLSTCKRTSFVADPHTKNDCVLSGSAES